MVMEFDSEEALKKALNTLNFIGAPVVTVVGNLYIIENVQ